MLAPDVSLDSRIPYVSLPHNPLNLLDGFGRGKLEDVSGTVEEAESLGDEAAISTPRRADSLRWLSELLRDEGRVDESERAVEEANSLIRDEG